MYDYGGRTDLLSQRYIHLYGRTQLVLQALTIVQTIIHHCSNVITTGNPGLMHCVIKCVGG